MTYSYAYNKNGLKKSFTAPDGATYEYTYDSNNQPAGISIPGQGYITYNAYTWNSPVSITYPGGTKKEYTYNPLMQIKSLTVKDPGQNQFMNYNYQYSPAGNITAKNTEHGNYAYNYDSLYQLTEAINPALPQETFTYDKAGNRLTETKGQNPAINYTHNANNEMTSVDSTAYSYDQNGNIIQETNGSQITKFNYNSADRLERVELPDGRVATYTYDPFGRRIKKDVNGQITYYVYSDEGLIGEYDSTGNIQKAYGWIPDSIWGTNPVYMVENNQYYFYHNDHLGTPQELTDINGSVVWSATYTAFGEAIVDSSSTVINNLRFPGQYYDSETGKHYNWNRYYDPKTGKYISEDPIGLAGGDINYFSYVGNNPVNRTDPKGLEVDVPFPKWIEKIPCCISFVRPWYCESKFGAPCRASCQKYIGVGDDEKLQRCINVCNANLFGCNASSKCPYDGIPMK